MLVGQINAGQFQATIIEPTATEAGKSQFEPLPNNRTATRTRFDITIGLLNAPLNAELLTLAVTLAVVSIGIWLTAAIWGRWLCRRALAPVRQMADTAHLMQQLPESDSLLIVPPSNDELTDLGQAFNNLLGTLRTSIEQQRRFAGDASHQLRTPLAATLTAVEVALRREREPQEYQRILDVVRTRSRELTKIVETLLALRGIQARNIWQILKPSISISVVSNGWMPGSIANERMISNIIPTPTQCLSAPTRCSSARCSTTCWKMPASTVRWEGPLSSGSFAAAVRRAFPSRIAGREFPRRNSRKCSNHSFVRRGHAGMANPAWGLAWPLPTALPRRPGDAWKLRVRKAWEVRFV